MINKTVQYPKSTILLCFIVFFIASLGVTKLTFNSDYRIFFEQTNSDLQAFEALQNTYTKNDNILFVVTPKNGILFENDALLAIEKLTEKAWLLPYAIRVDSLTNFQYTFSNGDELIVEDLIKTPLSDDELQRKKQIALAEPLLANRLLSLDGKVTGINVTFQLPQDYGADIISEIAAAANALKHEMSDSFQALEFRTTGVIMQTHAFSESSVHDSKTLLPLMLASMLILSGLLFKSFFASICVLVLMIGSVLPALGIAGWLGMSLNTATLAAPIMIMTLAIADTVHVLHNFYLSYSDPNKKREAILDSLNVNWTPIVLTSVTTMLGFLSLNFSESPPFHQLGNIVAMGVAWAMVLSLSLLPALMSLKAIPVNHRYKRMEFQKLFSGLIQHKNKAFVVAIVAVLVITPFAAKNELNDVWLHYFSKQLSFRQQADYAQEHLTGGSSLHYSIEAEHPYGITEPTFLKRLDEFAVWLESQPEVQHVNVITDILKRLNKNLHQDDPSEYRLPQSKEQAAQILLLYEMSLPYGLDLNNQINVDKSSTRLQAIMMSLSTNELLNFIDRVEAYQHEHLPEWMHATATGPDVMFAHLGYTNIRTMLWGTSLALLMISLLLVVAFRSVKFGLLTLMPNLLPAAVAFGIWGFFVGEIGLSLSVVTGMTLGIIVDDTIHFVSKFLRGRRTNSADAALQYTFKMVGPALVITSLILILGFGLLSLSTFKLNSSMGFLTALTIAIALILDFMLLPAGLTWLSQLEKKPIHVNKEQS